MIVIYRITNSKDGKTYVGSTSSLKNRWKCHKSNLRSGRHHSRRLQFAWDVYGESCFSFDVIEHCDAAQRTEREQFWIDCLNAYGQDTGYNCCPIAGSVLHRKHSQKTKEKISIAHIGKKKSEEHRRKVGEAQLGRVTSPETKLKISIAITGRKFSQETIRKMVESRKGFRHSLETKEKIRRSAIGRTVSDEARRKISIAGTGRRWSEKTRAKIMSREVLPPTAEHKLKISKSRGGKPYTLVSQSGESFKFDTLGEAKDILGLDPSNVRKCLIGQSKQYRGYTGSYDNP